MTHFYHSSSGGRKFTFELLQPLLFLVCQALKEICDFVSILELQFLQPTLPLGMRTLHQAFDVGNLRVLRLAPIAQITQADVGVWCVVRDVGFDFLVHRFDDSDNFLHVQLAVGP